MATQANVDLARVEGSGHKGRIVRFDVERSLGVRGRPQPSAPPPPETAPERHSARPVAPAFGHEVPGRDEVLNGARKRAAERLAEAKRTAPHFYLDLECDAERLIELRSELNEGRGDEERPKLTLNDLVVRIAALAFRRVPEANVSWQDGVLRVHERVDLAVAVASEHGLVTPVVRDAGRKGVGEIAVALRDLAGRAQQGKLRPEEYTGGTATLSNLGMYGVRRLYPILNLPQACILGVGSVEPSVVARDGEPVVRRTVVVTLAADHRALDGATGARLLAAFRALVENPLEMLL
jgi:pyruvate dehydrogenase E2 component (dihydrolipoamide acetyltransferase)